MPVVEVSEPVCVTLVSELSVREPVGVAPGLEVSVSGTRAPNEVETLPSENVVGDPDSAPVTLRLVKLDIPESVLDAKLDRLGVPIGDAIVDSRLVEAVLDAVERMDVMVESDTVLDDCDKAEVVVLTLASDTVKGISVEEMLDKILEADSKVFGCVPFNEATETGKSEEITPDCGDVEDGGTVIVLARLLIVPKFDEVAVALAAETNI